MLCLHSHVMCFTRGRKQAILVPVKPVFHLQNYISSIMFPSPIKSRQFFEIRVFSTKKILIFKKKSIRAHKETKPLCKSNGRYIVVLVILSDCNVYINNAEAASVIVNPIQQSFYGTGSLLRSRHSNNGCEGETVRDPRK